MSKRKRATRERGRQEAKKSRQRTEEAAAPIQNLDAIDMIGQRIDGGLDLVITVSAKLKDSDERRKLLYDKLNTYLATLAVEEFQAEFGAPAKVRILVTCAVTPDPAIADWIKSIVAPLVRKEAVELVLEGAAR